MSYHHYHPHGRIPGARSEKLELKMETVLSVIAGVVKESLQLQGARGLDLERATSGDTSDDKVPEQLLNICLVSEIFVQILATGVGTLAFIWATVVLLGGFSIFLHKVDFWVITGIIFIQAAKIVGLNSNAEAKFFAQVPPAILELGAEYFTGRGRPSTGHAPGRDIVYYIMLGLGSARDFVASMALLTSVLLLLPLVAGSSCIGLSISRLLTITKHKQYRGSSADGSTSNVLSALIFFYALVLAQGGLFLIWLAILLLRSLLKEQLCSAYRFQGKDKKLIDKYINRTTSACIKTGVLNTINRKLVSFAADLLHSEYSEDRISGVQVLHTLTSVAGKTHSERTLAQIQTSPDWIARMFVLLRSKSTTIDEDSRVNLARIVTKISSELRLSDIDGAMESISSLIDPYLTKISTPANNSVNNGQQRTTSDGTNSQQGNSQSPSLRNGEKNHPLIIHGLKILAKLAGNPDNCIKIFSTKGLFSKITAPIRNKMYSVFTYDDTAIEVTKKSLRVVSKLVKGTDEINADIRNEICRIGLVVDRIHPILTSDQQRYNSLKIPAIKILSELALVNLVGDDIMVGYIQQLMGLIFEDSTESTMKKAAAKALALLATNSTTHRAAIMNWSSRAAHSVVDQLSPMLSVTSYRNAVAQLLTQFWANSPDAQITDHPKSILHKVLEVIICEVDEALGTDQWNPHQHQQQNRSRAEVTLHFFVPCIDTSSFVSRGSQGASQNQSAGPAPGDNGSGNTSQNQSAGQDQGILSGLSASAGLRYINGLVNVPGESSIGRRNSSGDDVEAQASNTPIRAGSRKTLVAFLGLALQICAKLRNADDFDAAVAQLGLIPHEAEFVEKLGKIVGMCNKDSVGLLKGRRPSVDYLLMIKSATKLCTWVMRAKPSYVTHFQEKNIDQKLKDALDAMRGLDLGELLLTCSGGVDDDELLTKYETLSSIVDDARRLIVQSDPKAGWPASLDYCSSP